MVKISNESIYDNAKSQKQNNIRDFDKKFGRVLKILTFDLKLKELIKLCLIAL